jgi:ABC-type nitrate/sulfonate/bicarbonate transport system ATPase subunit
MIASRMVRRAHERLEHLGYRTMKGCTLGRQCQRTMAALEQRHAERVLERFDLSRQRRLSQEQFFGGERERQASARGLEASQKIQRW